MRKYILLALVLLVAGVGVSLTLIPSKDDVAANRAQDVAAAPMAPVNAGGTTALPPGVDPEAEYNAGRRSFAVVAALADKRVTEGKRDEAVKLLEEYVKTNGNDPQGHKKLAEQYQLAGRMADYNRELEQLAAAAPTEENLRLLSDIYNASKDYPKQVEVLKKIVDVTKGEKPQTFVDLATMQVVVGDEDGAFKTVNDLKAKHPQFTSYPMTRILVSVLAKQGKVDEAFTIAQNWINAPDAPLANPAGAPTAPTTPDANTDPKPGQLADLCNILHYSGHADKAVALVEPHLDMLPRSPELVVAYVKANITDGRSDHAYAILQKIDEAGKMSALLYPPYLDLAIKREDIPAAETIANKMDTASFTEEQALDVIEVARANNAPSVLTILTTRFEDAKVLEGKPVLAAVISILKNEKEQDQKINTALSIQMSPIQRERLAESCARAHKTQCFDAILKQFPPMDNMSPAQVAEFAQLYIIANRPAEIVDQVGAKAQMVNAHADITSAHRRLSASAGRYDNLKGWLAENATKVPENHLQDLFYLANNNRHTDISSDVAERLYARDPSPMNRDILVAGYIGAGQDDKALPLLRDKLKEPGTNDGQYLAVLSKVARKDASARKELADYAQAALQSGNGDNRQQLNYAYVLINNGRKDTVIPYAKQFSTERGGEWKKMYAQLTTKAVAGKAAPKLTREQMIAMSQSKSISAANKRQLAFNLLAQGYKADATTIFADLAKDKGPESQEVKDLMYMWGGKLSGDQLAWINARAAAASPYDKAKWADLINAQADDQATLQYVSSTPDALYSQPLRKRYFSILARTGNKQNYDTAMQSWVAQTTDVPALTDYASTATAFGYKDAAKNAYNRILTIDPNNAKALSQTAALDFAKGNYRDADARLNQYLATGQNAPDTDAAQAHFLKAELLKKQGNMAGAQAEYNAVLQSTNSQAPDALSRLYTAQFNLGQSQQAMQGFNALLAAHPNDKGILADYMSALIEHKYFDEATRVANQYDKSSPYYGRTSALNGKAAQVAAIERFSHGREMKITFAAPIEGKSPVRQKDLQKLAWLEHAELGYDTLTVSAKPGYVVRYVPTAEQQFAIVPSQEVTPEVETERQQQLRLQLLYAQIEQQTGQTERAKQRLAAIQQYYPQEPQLIVANANIASAEGDFDRSTQLLKQAHTLVPENEDYAAVARVTRNVDSKQFVKLDHAYRNYGATDEHITTLSGVAKVANDTEIGANLMNDYIDPTKGIIQPHSGTVTSRAAMRQAGELFVGHYFDSGSRVQGSVFSNTDTAGLGAYYAFTSPVGRSEVLAEFHKPYWDFPEAVYSFANRDRVGFRNYADVGKRVSLGVESSLNRYNSKEEDDAAQSALFRLSATYALQQQTKNAPFLGVGYGFDGEYLFDEPARRTVAGNNYKVFNMRSREVHQLTGIYRDDWGTKTHALFDAGWVYDRIGGENGPVVEGRVDHDLTDKLEIGARGRYSKISSGSDGDATELGADIMYKF